MNNLSFIFMIICNWLGMREQSLDFDIQALFKVINYTVFEISLSYLNLRDKIQTTVMY